MTTPEIPSTGTDAPPIPTPTPAAPSEIDVRELATQITAPQLSFDPSTIRKAIVTGIVTGTVSTPPTVSVQVSGDTSVTIDGVRMSDDYSPQIGDTVLILKQGSEVFCLTHIAATSSKVLNSTVGGWTVASLAGGLSHNGNGNGNVMYRRVLEDGCWKMQWQGACSGSPVTGNLLASPLAADFTPSSKQSLLAAREGSTGSNAIGMDFRTDGQVQVTGGTVAPFTQTPNESGHGHSGYTTFVDPNDVTTTNSSHSHGVVGGHDHDYAFTNPSYHTHGGHHHDVNDPNWVSFSGLEYFL